MLELLARLKYLKENLTLTILVPVVLTIVGSFVANFYLEKYFGIMDYQIVKVQLIYVGAMAAIFLVLSYFFFHYDDDFQSNILLYFATITKILISSNFVDSLIRLKENKYIKIYLILSLFSCGVYIIFYILKDSRCKWRKFISWFLLFAILLTNFLIWRDFTDDWVLCFFISNGLLYLFLKKYNTSNSLTYFYFVFLSLLFISLSFYTEGIYAYLPSSIGGGLSEKCYVVLKSSDGRKCEKFPNSEIVHRTNDYVYIVNEEEVNCNKTKQKTPSKKMKKKSIRNVFIVRMEEIEKIVFDVEEEKKYL